jgi:hypothetical protein
MQMTTSNDQAVRLREIIHAVGLFDILQAIRAEKLTDWWLAGGAVRNSVWRYLFGENCKLAVKDFDVAFFERDTGREREQAAKAHLEAQWPQLIFDVKNQASFGVWRPWHFTFESTADGIAHWLHTATAVGVRVNDLDEIEVLSPYGLDDLLNGVVRPTPFVVGSKASRDKGAEFLARCPALRAID